MTLHRAVSATLLHVRKCQKAFTYEDDAVEDEHHSFEESEASHVCC